MQFCGHRRFEAYNYRGIRLMGSKQTNNIEFRGWKILIPTKILFMWKCILQWNLYNEVLGLTNYFFFDSRWIVKFRVIPHLFQRLFLISWENRRDCHITMPLCLKTVEVQIKGGHWNKRFRTVQFYWKFKAIWKMSFLTNEPAKKAEINILTAREQGFGTRPGHHG